MQAEVYTFTPDTEHPATILKRDRYSASRYVVLLSGDGTIRVTHAGMGYPGHQLTTFRQPDPRKAKIIARAIGDWAYRHYDC